MSCEIPTDLLAEDDLPPPNAEWEAIARLALSFNGCAYSEKCGEIANAVAAAFARDHKVPGTLSLDDLRACLFFEQRRWRHFGEIPDEHAMAYIRRLIEAISTTALHMPQRSQRTQRTSSVCLLCDLCVLCGWF